MTEPIPDCRAELRRSVYLLLVFLGAGAMLARILAVDAVDMAGLEKYRLDVQRAEEILDRGISQWFRIVSGQSEDKPTVRSGLKI